MSWKGLSHVHHGLVATTPARRGLQGWLWPLVVLAIAYGAVPIIGTDYLFEAILTPCPALCLAAVGLNLLTGYAGWLSLGSAAFMRWRRASLASRHRPPHPSRARPRAMRL